MIVDAHTHVYTTWPAPDAPDAHQRGAPARLLGVMDSHRIARALLVAAILQGGDTNALTLQSEHDYPDRFVALPQLDSMGSPTHHTPGAAERLAELHERHGGIRGFAHYCRDYAWFETSDGRALFAKAAELRHVVSIAVFSPGLVPLARLAEHFPSLTFLVHHMGRLQEKTETQPNLSALRATASCANIWFKISGFHHLAADPKAYPYFALQPVVRALYETLGPRRLVWASDAPVVTQHLTYGQALDVFRDHSPYVSEPDRALILGGNLARLFAWT